jgi:hypothetical protein
MRWRVTPRVQSHRNPDAKNYPCVLLELDGSEQNLRRYGDMENFMFTDNEFMDGVVLMMTYSPTIKQRIIDYVNSLRSWKGGKCETLAELLL